MTIEELAEVSASNGYTADDQESALDSSMLGKLRQRREQLSQDREPLELPIPGYNGDLVAKYRVLPWQEIRLAAEKADRDKSPLSELMAACDMLIKSCVGMYVQGNDGLEPIDADAAAPVGYDARLAGLLGYEAETAREVIRRLFNNDLALAAHHADVAEWWQSTGQEDEERFVGEHGRTSTS